MESLDEFLASLGLEHLKKVFDDNEIGLRDLPLLDEGDLAQLDVPLGPRKRILKAIGEMRAARGRAGAPAGPKDRAGGDPERRQLTIMFCDLVDSTALTQHLDPEDMRALMLRYQDAVVAAVNRYGGHVAKFMGDGVLAYFGYPRPFEDASERALLAGLELVPAIAELSTAGAELVVRIGVATGPVVVGDLIGEGAAQEEAVVGETPHLAARLQDLARPGSELVVSETTRKLAGNAFIFRDLGPQALKGFTAPVPAFAVAGLASTEGRFEAHRRGRILPMVGRDAELAQLMECWSLAEAGQGQLVLIAGDAGIGKSRLVRGLSDGLAGRGHVRLRYQCSPYHTGSALYPAIEHLERVTGLSRDAPAAEQRARLDAVLLPGPREAAQRRALIANLLSIPVEDGAPALNMSPQKQLDETLEALREQIDALAASQPVLMLIEDAHWADPTFLDLLGRTIARIGAKPVMMAVTHRPEFRPPWPAADNVTELALSRLGAREARDMLAEIADGKDLPEEVAARILEKADGVPLFLEEVAESVLSSGQLTAPLPSIAMPATLQDTLAARLDHRAPVKRIAQIASVIGREFDFALLAEVAPVAADEVERLVGELMGAGLIFGRGAPPAARYQFKHALVRDAAYDLLLRDDRRHLHAEIARAMERLNPRVREQQPELLAHHVGQSGQPEVATDLWMLAATRAAARANNLEAIQHVENGLAASEEIADEATRLARQIDLCLLLAGANAGLYGYGHAALREAAERGLGLCKRLGAIEKSVPFYSMLVANDWSLNRLNRAAEVNDLAFALNDRVDPEHSLFWIQAQRGALNTQRGRIAFAAPYIAEVKRHYDPGVSRDLVNAAGLDLRMFCICYSPMAKLYRGDWQGAEAEFAEIERQALALDHHFTSSMAYFFFAWIAAIAEDLAAAERWSKRCIQIGDEQSLPFWSAFAQTILAYVEGRAGAFARALPRAEAAMELNAIIGSKLAPSMLFYFVGSLLIAAGEHDRAMRMADGLEETVRTSGDTLSLAFWLETAAGLKAALGEAPAARALYDEMLTLGADRGLVWTELRAMHRLAPLMAAAGEAGRAAQRIDDICARLVAPGESPLFRDVVAMRRAL